MDTLELQRRQQLALDAIKQSFGTAAASDSVDLFIEHHLEALPAGYWLQQLGTETPEPSAVLGRVRSGDRLGGGWSPSNRLEIGSRDGSLPSAAAVQGKC